MASRYVSAISDLNAEIVGRGEAEGCYRGVKTLNMQSCRHYITTIKAQHIRLTLHNDKSPTYQTDIT